MFVMLCNVPADAERLVDLTATELYHGSYRNTSSCFFKNCKQNKNAFQSKANRLLPDSYIGYIVNTFARVWGPGMGKWDLK